MDAVEFLKERTRMCNFYMSMCMNCPGNKVAYCATLCAAAIELVPIVEQWSKEHPAKTRLSELRNIFPLMDEEGIMDDCPLRFDRSFHERDDRGLCTEPGETACYECTRRFWMEELKEGET